MIHSENEDFCDTEAMVSSLGFQRPSPPGAALSRSMSLNNDPPIFDWSRWGVIRSENEDFCGTEEMVSPLGFQRPLPPEAALSRSMSLNNGPLVFDWGRWGVIRFENEDFRGPEEMGPLSHVVNHPQPYLPIIVSGGGFHEVYLAEDEPPVFDWDTWGVIPVIGSGRLCHRVDRWTRTKKWSPFIWRGSWIVW